MAGQGDDHGTSIQIGTDHDAIDRTQTFKLGAGRVSGIAVDPNDPNLEWSNLQAGDPTVTPGPDDAAGLLSVSTRLDDSNGTHAFFHDLMLS